MRRLKILAILVVLAAWAALPGCLSVKAPEEVRIGGGEAYYDDEYPGYVGEDGVYVDAPGVRVRTGSGGTRVRAPFVDVDVP
jgi:hypothetical protein